MLVVLGRISLIRFSLPTLIMCNIGHPWKPSDRYFCAAYSTVVLHSNIKLEYLYIIRDRTISCFASNNSEAFITFSDKKPVLQANAKVLTMSSHGKSKSKDKKRESSRNLNNYNSRENHRSYYDDNTVRRGSKDSHKDKKYQNETFEPTGYDCDDDNNTTSRQSRFGENFTSTDMTMRNTAASGQMTTNPQEQISSQESWTEIPEETNPFNHGQLPLRPLYPGTVYNSATTYTSPPTSSMVPEETNLYEVGRRGYNSSTTYTSPLTNSTWTTPTIGEVFDSRNSSSYSQTRNRESAGLDDPLQEDIFYYSPERLSRPLAFPGRVTNVALPQMQPFQYPLSSPAFTRTSQSSGYDYSNGLSGNPSIGPSPLYSSSQQPQGAPQHLSDQNLNFGLESNSQIQPLDEAFDDNKIGYETQRRVTFSNVNTEYSTKPKTKDSSKKNDYRHDPSYYGKDCSPQSSKGSGEKQSKQRPQKDWDKSKKSFKQMYREEQAEEEYISDSVEEDTHTRKINSRPLKGDRDSRRKKSPSYFTYRD
jgi:hypothetical protein